MYCDPMNTFEKKNLNKIVFQNKILFVKSIMKYFFYLGSVSTFVYSAMNLIRQLDHILPIKLNIKSSLAVLSNTQL